MESQTVRIVICGDEGVGKSSLVTSLTKEIFVPNIQSVVPPINIPRDFSNSSSSTIVVDTPADNVPQLQYEIRQANCIWLVYADHYTYERISLYWIPMFRSMGVNLPIVVCCNKMDMDMASDTESEVILHEEFTPLLLEFKEIEACIRTSAKINHNVNKAFYLCQRAVTHPLAPLYDYKYFNLKPLAVFALKRVFYLCDTDQDGYLNENEFLELQQRCFHKTLDFNELQDIKNTLEEINLGLFTDRGINEEGFIKLNKYYCESGRHETIWGILREFHYTDSLSIDDKILYPKMDIPQHSSVELSPKGYKFLVDLFILFDKDNDGGLNDMELERLFYPTPGIPKAWEETNFPRSVVCNQQGYVTLQGWLAQWSMTTYLDYRTTLEYLGYFGYEENAKSSKRGPDTTSALHVTKPRRLKKRDGKIYRTPVPDRTVFNCFIVGFSGCGKTSLLEAFLSRPFSTGHAPTLGQKVAVNNVEIVGGKQCYLILQELGGLETAILENNGKLENCDVLCFAYDSSDSASFQHLIDLKSKYSELDTIPTVYVALKADLDRQQQRADYQPEPYTKSLFLSSPLHVSSNWTSSLGELMTTLVQAASNPQISTPNLVPYPTEREPIINPFTIGCGALGFMAIISAWYLRGSVLGKS